MSSRSRKLSRVQSDRRLPRLLVAAVTVLLFPVAPARSQETTTARGAKTARPSGTVPVYRCEGFADPLDKGAVTINRGRTLPLRANLYDATKAIVGASRLKARPEVRVVTKPRKGVGEDVTDSIEARDFGQGVQFVYKEEYWKFDLGTDGLTDVGDYEVRLASGNETEYRVEPACRLAFSLQ